MVRVELAARRWSKRTTTRCTAWRLPTDNAPHLYLALLSYRLVAAELDTLIARINLGRDDADLLHEVAACATQIEPLQVKDVRPSEVYHLLDALFRPGDPGRLGGHRLARRARPPVAPTGRPIATSNRSRPATTSRQMGLPPGPIYGRILGALRDARLDGEIASRESKKRRWPRTDRGVQSGVLRRRNMTGSYARGRYTEMVVPESAGSPWRYTPGGRG